MKSTEMFGKCKISPVVFRFNEFSCRKIGFEFSSLVIVLTNGRANESLIPYLGPPVHKPHPNFLSTVLNIYRRVRIKNRVVNTSMLSRTRLLDVFRVRYY